MFKQTTAQKKIAKLRKRIRIVRGGTSSSKTYSIIPLLIQYAVTKPRVEISIVSETIPHLKKGAMRDFKKIMNDVELWNDKKWNASNHIYTFNNGSIIEFFSADQPAKVRGPRRDVLFINECNNIDFETYHQLAIRTSRFIYLDYNPVQEFWVDTELMNDPDAEMIILTYKDNEALSPAIIKEIEKAKEKAKTSTYWQNWWNVYGLGQIGSLQGVVFNNWELIDRLPDEAKLIGYGLDFGFTTDPTAIIAVYEYEGKRIAKEVTYSTGMMNADIARLLPRYTKVFADSADPKSIKEIQMFGISIKGATKGADSIRYGIQVMQSQEYLITKDSHNLIKELRGYCWDTDKTGKSLNVPKGTDHAIDALRYHEVMTLGVSRPTGKYSIS